MISKQQAMTEDMFHDFKCGRWRRNGATKTWKTRPDEFRVPVKWGLRSYDYITHLNASEIHLPGDEGYGCKEQSI